MDRQCHFYQLDSLGCTTFATCDPQAASDSDVFHYRLRLSSPSTELLEPGRGHGSPSGFRRSRLHPRHDLARESGHLRVLSGEKQRGKR